MSSFVAMCLIPQKISKTGGAQSIVPPVGQGSPESAFHAMKAQLMREGAGSILEGDHKLMPRGPFMVEGQFMSDMTHPKLERTI